MCKINKIIILLIFIIIFSSCSYNYKTNIADVIDAKVSNDGKEINLRGYLFIHQYNMIQIYSSKDSLENNKHFDVVINNESNIIDFLYENKFICVDLIGTFQAHSPGVILSGYLTSLEGLIVANKISKCKK